MKNCLFRALVGSSFALATLAASAPQQLSAQSRPDSHAPIGVMGDHLHAKGEIMFSYRYMRMNMEGTRDGTDGVSDADVVAAGGPYGYMVTPTAMPMDMHMVGFMAAPSDRVTLMVMGNFLSNSMDHLTRPGGAFTTESSGFGDTRASALISLKSEGVKVHLNAGVSLPTGSIDERDATPASAPNEVRLPYPMQIGSGTFDLEPGITIYDVTEGGAWGLQARGVIRTGENDNEYTLGNRFLGTAWMQYRVFDQLSASVRIEGQRWGNVDGADPLLNPGMIYTADPDLRAGTRIDLPLGFNWYFIDGLLNDHRLAVEFNIPVYQDLDGPQLETDWVLTVGWQKAFGVF